MKLIEKIEEYQKIDDLPSINNILTLKRGINLKIIFNKNIEYYIPEYYKKLSVKLFDFTIRWNSYEKRNYINISKLITESEIIQNQNFIEKCVKDYGELSEKLVFEFCKKFRVKFNKGFPSKTLNPGGNFWYKQSGKMNQWDYFFHGFHCGFINRVSGQAIEVPLMCGSEFGELDPYFFIQYIITSKDYDVSPIYFYDENAFDDGDRILTKMIEIGKFELIQSNWPDRKSVVVINRKKVEVKLLNYDKPEFYFESRLYNLYVKLRLKLGIK